MTKGKQDLSSDQAPLLTGEGAGQGKADTTGKGPWALSESKQGREGQESERQGGQSRTLGKRPVESPLLVPEWLESLFTLVLTLLPPCILNAYVTPLSLVFSEARHTHKCSLGRVLLGGNH